VAGVEKKGRKDITEFVEPKHLDLESTSSNLYE
jgi:hypothetical protein